MRALALLGLVWISVGTACGTRGFLGELTTANASDASEPQAQPATDAGQLGANGGLGDAAEDSITTAVDDLACDATDICMRKGLPNSECVDGECVCHHNCVPPPNTPLFCSYELGPVYQCLPPGLEAGTVWTCDYPTAFCTQLDAALGLCPRGSPCWACCGPDAGGCDLSLTATCL